MRNLAQCTWVIHNGGVSAWGVLASFISFNVYTVPKNRVMYTRFPGPYRDFSTYLKNEPSLT